LPDLSGLFLKQKNQDAIKNLKSKIYNGQWSEATNWIILIQI